MESEDSIQHPVKTVAITFSLILLDRELICNPTFTGREKKEEREEMRNNLIENFIEF